MITFRTTYRLFLFLLLGVVINACIEPFEIEARTFESALVVDATITDEEKEQKVVLSRAFPIDSEGPLPETGAQVKVVGEDQTEYSFQETVPGTYVSLQPFAAQAGVGYALHITTSDGNSYTSESERTPDKVAISNLYVARETNDLGEDGVSILLDNTAPLGEPKYFRYTYEETYKIIAPNWTPLVYDIIDDDIYDGDSYQVGLTAEEEPRQICYKTTASTDILQISTASLGENTISRFTVKFLNRMNYAIAYRYSILVKQFTQTPEAFFYFQKLKDFSSSESIFTDIQAGFLEGNIRSATTNQKVIGYFEVAAKDERRVYFNYSDVFPGEPRPNYPVACDLELNIPLKSAGYHTTIINGELVCDGSCESPLINAIRSGDIAYFQTAAGYEGYTDEELSYIAPYISKVVGCIDCRVLGNNVKPDFWEE